MDFYQLLGITKTATLDEIKKAHREKVMQCHPDRCPGDPDAERKFKEVQQAYEVLSDPNKRAEYDQFGTVKRRPPSKQEARKNPHNEGFSNIWEEFFGGSVNKGRSVQTKVEITLEEAFAGVSKSIKIQQKGRCGICEGKGYTEWEACNNCSGSGRAFLKQNPFNIFITCQSCGGTGRSATVNCKDCIGTGFTPKEDKILDVTIPPGIDTGMQIRLPNEGEPGRNGTRNGDVFVIIIVKEHSLFKRLQKDLIVEVPVSYTEILLGSEITLPTIEGGKVSFNISPGAITGTKFRLQNQGMPGANGEKRGDMVALVKVVTPENLSDDYKKIIEELAKFEKENPTLSQQEFKKKCL